MVFVCSRSCCVFIEEEKFNKHNNIEQKCPVMKSIKTTKKPKPHFKCTKCEKTFVRKRTLVSHMEKCFEDVNKIINGTNNIPKDNIESNICGYCFCSFRDKYTKAKHLKVCKIKKNVDLMNNLTDVKYSAICNLVDSSNNTINNTINSNNININNIVLPFMNTDLTYLNNKDYRNIAKKSFKSIEELIKQIHFNPKQPQNHNIKISNKKLNDIKIWEGILWSTKDKTEFMDDLFLDYLNLLEEKVDSIQKTRSKLSKRDLHRFKRFIDCYNTQNENIKNRKRIDNLIKDINDLCYNNNDLVEETHKK